MTTITAESSYKSAMDSFSKRIYMLEQRMSNPSVVHQNEFEEIIINPGPEQYVLNNTSSPPTSLVLSWGTFFDTVFIDASWTAPVDESAAEYEVWLSRKTGPSTYTLENAYRTGATSIRLQPVDPNVTYGVRVYSINRVGKFSDGLPSSSTWQDILTGADSTSPGGVNGIAASAGFKSVTVRWDENTETDVKNGKGFYRVEIDTSSAFSGVNYKASTVQGTIMAFNDLSTGTQYFIRVSAFDSSGNQGPLSPNVSTTPSGPGYVTVTTSGAAEGDIQDGAVTSRKTSFEVGGGNGFSNSSFEVDGNADGIADAWSIVDPSGTNPTKSIATDQKYHDAKAQKLVLNASAGSKGVYQSQNVINGQKYTASIWVRHNAGSNQNFFVISTGTTSSAISVPPNTWQRLVLSTTATVTTAYNIQFYTTGVSFSVWFDAAQFESGDVPTAYSPRPDEVGTLAPGSITSTEIADGSITSNKIAAGAVTAEKITVGGFGNNQAPNPSFEEASFLDPTGPSKWTFTSATTPGIKVYSTGYYHSGTKSVGITCTSAQSGYWTTTDLLPIDPGNTLAIESWINVDTATTRGLYIGVFWYDDALTLLFEGNIINDAGITPTWAFASGQLVAPSTARWYRPVLVWYQPNVTATAYFDSVYFGVVTNSVRIQDGAVIASKILAGAVTTEKLTVAAFGDNYVANPSFEEVSASDSTLPARWTRGVLNNGGSAVLTTTSANVWDGFRAIAITATSAQIQDIWSSGIPVNPGQVWYISVRARANVAITDGFWVVGYFGATETHTSNNPVSSTQDQPVSTSFVRFEGQITVPAGVSWMRIGLINSQPNATSTIYVDKVEARAVIVTAQLYDGVITANKIAAGAVVAGKIAAQSIGADEIAAHSITSDRIVVSGFGENLVNNYSFEEVDPADPTMPAGWERALGGTATFTHATDGHYSGYKSAKIVMPAAGGYCFVRTKSDSASRIPVEPGKVYQLGAYTSSNLNVGFGFYLGVDWYGVSGTYIGTTYIFSDASVSTTWTRRAAQLTADGSARSCIVVGYYQSSGTAVTVWMDHFELRRAQSGVNIENGAITAPKIVAGEIDSDHIVTAGLDAAVIKFGTMSGDRITANTLSAASIKTSTLNAGAVTINGGSLIVGSGATGPGVLVNSSGIRLYASGGVVKVFLDGTTGNANFTGAISSSTLSASDISGGTITGSFIQTASSGNRLVLDNASQGRLLFYNSFWGTPAEIISTNNLGFNSLNVWSGAGSSQSQSVIILSGSASGSDANGSNIWLETRNSAGSGGLGRITLNGFVNVQNTLTTAAGISASGNIFTTGNIETSFNQTVGATGITSGSTGTLAYFKAASSTTTLCLSAGLGAVNEWECLLSNLTSYAAIKALAFNLSSSIETKRQVRPASAGYLEAIKQLRPVHYKMLPVVLESENEEGEQIFVRSSHPADIAMQERDRLGFVAEELAEVLPGLASYNREQQPTGIDVAQLAALGIKGIQELLERVELLEERVGV